MKAINYFTLGGKDFQNENFDLHQKNGKPCGLKLHYIRKDEWILVECRDQLSDL